MVTPGEISEIITHLAFYSGWGNAMTAVAAASDVFAQRGIGADQLPAASSDLLPLDKAAEEQRATRVQRDVGAVSPGLVELHPRPPVSRSVAPPGPCASGSKSGDRQRVDRLRPGRADSVHLNRAMDNGLTKAQASEVLTHLAFYAGWPNAMSAVPVAKSVFDSRPASTLTCCTQRSFLKPTQS